VYFPFLRGRQHELAAIQATATQMAKSGKIIPIVEPVKANTKSLERAASVALQANVPIVIVTNPRVGELVGAPDVLQSAAMAPLLQNAGLLPAFVLGTGTSASHVSAFSKRYGKRKVCFIHASTPANQVVSSVNAHGPGAIHVVAQSVASSYVKALTGQLVELRDSFNRLPRNAAYPSSEFFSDVHLTFKSKKLAGFSDFSIVGDFYVDSGGPAHAVAIHLHEEQPTGLWLRHFVSTRVTGPQDPAGKFAEAVAKLDAFAAKNQQVAATVACSEFRKCHQSGHYPGLGVVKQLSIRHHIETLASIL
jgi:hypothetical protein